MSVDLIPTGTEPFSFELERLLAPISVEHPSGEWLRYEGLFASIESARQEDDATLPQGVWKRDLKRADWPRVASLCLDALETRSKDLQLAAWLLQAWVHHYGFPGLEAGLKLLIALCESFWDDLHPRIEPGDMDARTSPLRWLNERIPITLKRVPVTWPDNKDASPYCWADWESALRHANLAAGAPKAAEADVPVSQSKFQVSVSLTRSAFYIQLAETLRSSLEAVDDLAALLEKKCGADRPSLLHLRETIEALRAFGIRVLEERSEDEPDGPVIPEGIPTASVAGPATRPQGEAGGTPEPSSIRSRAEAFRRLSEAADYLQRTEPHSPAPYLVKRAIAWGSMPLSELLEELLAGKSDLQTIYTLLGIKDVAPRGR